MPSWCYWVGVGWGVWLGVSFTMLAHGLGLF